MKKNKIKWHEKNDTFTLDRETLCDITEFARYPMWLKKKDRPIHWKEFLDETLNPVERVIMNSSTKLMRKELKKEGL
jgi:hypothetical protein